MQLKTLLICFFISVLSYGQHGDAEAKQIIQNAIIQSATNNPDLALEAFQFHSYTKGIFKTRDKNSLEIIPSESDYLFEEVALHRFDQKQKHQKEILGAHLPGFETPYYLLFKENFHSNSVYEKEYEVFDKRFHGPLSQNGLKHYIFELKETVTQSQRPFYIIHFSPLNNRAASQLSGTLHIDSKSFAVQQAQITHQENLAATITHDFTFIEEKEFWFPLKTTAEIYLLNAIENFNLFGNRIPPTRMNFEEGKKISFILESHFSEIKFQSEESWAKKQIDVTALIENNDPDTDFWNRFRESELTTEEAAIATKAEATIRDNYIEKRIQRINDFGLGYLELGFFDLDLKFLIKYNNYEGFRSGLGGVTNNRLSEHFSVGGYLVWGFKDEAFKYQLSTSFNINRASGTILGLSYTDDVAEMGTHEYLTDRRSFSLFEPRLVNIIQFYKHNTWETYLRHTIIPHLNAELEFSKSDVSQILNYEFLNNGQLYSDYQLTQAKASVLWSPFGKFKLTPNGISEYIMGFPRFSAQFTQSFQGFLDGNFNFSKIDLRADYLLSHMNQSSTEVVVEGNLGFGYIPLTHMYHAYPNSPNKETIMKRFSVAGIKSFETMYFGEFFSDKLATIHMKHQLKPFLIAPWLQPELVLITRHAIGTASNLDNHQNIIFNTLEKVYSESGLELNQLIFGFGVSFAYRYGAYQLPQFEDNISFKFTFNLRL